ncbi:hypothetical protein [Maricaulis sp. CAU 1757]
MSLTTITRPVWLGRAIVEALLIVFAVVLGFIVNEWRESVSDRRAAEAAMSRVVVEIKANITGLEAVVGYHEQVVDRIGARLEAIAADEAADRGIVLDELQQFMPRGVNPAGLSSFAWEHAQQHGRLDALPYETVANTARVYEWQADGVEATWRQIIDLLFAGPEVMREQDLRPSLRFTQIGFQELSSQERYLISQYERLLEDLQAAGFGEPEQLSTR